MNARNIVRLLLVVVAAVAFSHASAQRFPITWDVDAIAITIGNGQGTTDPVTVNLRSAVPLQDVELRVVPELRGFVQVRPSRIASVQPNTAYPVTLTFAIPTGAYQGLYDGTLHVVEGRRTVPQPLKLAVTVAYGDNVVGANTRVLSAATTDLLSDISPDGSTLTFNGTAADLAAVSVGNVMVLPSSPTLPAGFLGRVVAVTANSAGVTIFTEPAAITDALSHIDINLSLDLSQAVPVPSSRLAQPPEALAPSAAPQGLYVSLDGYEIYRDAKGGTITLDGSISANPAFTFNLTAQDWKLQRLSFIDTTTTVAELGITAEAEVLSLSKKFQVGPPIFFAPFTVWAGPVPVVITPQVTFIAGLDGSVSVGVTTSVTQTATATAGVKYDNGSWSTISNLTNSFSWEQPRASAKADPKLYGGPQFNLLLYGVVGPYAFPRAYLELDVDLFDHPQYQLFGGFEAAVGVRVAILDHNLVDQEWPATIGYRKLLAEGDFGSWKRRASFPPYVDLRGVISFSVGGQGYVVLPCWIATWNSDGVWCRDATMGQVWRFDADANKWTRLGNHPTGLQFQSPAFVLGGAAYVVSGNRVWKYTPGSDIWTRKNDIPGADKRNGFAFSVGGYGYLGGGFYNQGALWRYNPSGDNWTRLADHPNLLTYIGNDPSVRSIEGITFVLGGKAYVTGTGHYFWRYSPNTDSWTRKAYVDASRGQAFAIGQYGYVSNLWGQLFEYDPALDSWAAQPMFPGQTVCYPAGFAINDRLYVGIGGRMDGNVCNLDIVNDWWQFAP